MKEYLDFMSYVHDKGSYRSDRTGTGCKSIFGYNMSLDISDHFPLITTKKIHFASVVHELIWFLRGCTNVQYLRDHNISIWNEWADEKGDLGPIYGYQWRHFGKNSYNSGIDQITRLITSIRYQPYSRRHVITSWNPLDIDKMALPPCHVLVQFYVDCNKGLSCFLYQRSADVFLGVPFNIASYSLLTYMIAHVCCLQPKNFHYSLGDAHIYINHIEQVQLQLSRDCLPLPSLSISKMTDNIFDIGYEDFRLYNYTYHPHIKAPIAV